MPRARAHDYDEKRDAILHRAAEIFARDGYDRASMAQLATECGVSKALLYHYYASKETLLFDIVSNHLEALIEAVEVADDTALDAEARLEALVMALLESYRDADAEHQVQLNAMRLLPPGEKDALKRLEVRLVEIFAGAVRAVEPRAFDGRPLLKPVTMSLFGMLNWAYMWFRDDRGLSREDYARLATRLLVAGIHDLALRRPAA